MVDLGETSEGRDTMSNKPMPWIKLFPALLHDIRLFALNDRQKLRYYEMYMLAGQLNSDGAFIQDGKELTAAEIAHLLRVNDPKQFEKDLIALKKSRLIRANGHGPFIADFKDEQINWVELQKNNRERQARFKQSHSGNALLTDESHVDNAPRTRTRTRTRLRTRSRTKPTTPTPPSNERVGGLVGSMNELLAGPKFKSITKKGRAELTRIAQVLELAGLGQSKFITFISQVAIRSKPHNKLQLVLAALASAYDDKGANNKVIVAVHRIEKSTVPAQYFSPATWDVIPDPILKAAGDVGVKDKPRNGPQSEALKKLYARSKS